MVYSFPECLTLYCCHPKVHTGLMGHQAERLHAAASLPNALHLRWVITESAPAEVLC